MLKCNLVSYIHCVCTVYIVTSTIDSYYVIHFSIRASIRDTARIRLSVPVPFPFTFRSVSIFSRSVPVQLQFKPHYLSHVQAPFKQNRYRVQWPFVGSFTVRNRTALCVHVCIYVSRVSRLESFHCTACIQ